MSLYFRAVLGLLTACLAPSAYAQAATYLDADNPGEAAGMMHITVYSLNHIGAYCAKHRPHLAKEMDTALSLWKSREAALIAVSQKAVDHYQAQNHVVEAQQRTQLDQMLGTLDKSAQQDSLDLFCRRQAHNLTSGVWRQRTPRMYEFLEAWVQADTEASATP